MKLNRKRRKGKNLMGENCLIYDYAYNHKLSAELTNSQY